MPANAYKADINYFAEVNQTLTDAGHCTFDGIGLETENFYIQKTGAFLGHSGTIGSCLGSKGLTSAKIAVTNSYKGAMAGLNVDLQTIQAARFGTPRSFNSFSPTSRLNLA